MKDETNNGLSDDAKAVELPEVIEGGEITGIDKDFEIDPVEKHKLTTARWLAYALIAILAGSFVIHYAVMAWLAAQGKTEALERMENTFSAWLPVISGLSGAVVTYFFTRERNGKS